MSAYTHVTVGTNDLDRSRTFYDAVLATLGWTRVADLGSTSANWRRRLAATMPAIAPAATAAAPRCRCWSCSPCAGLSAVCCWTSDNRSGNL